MSAPHFQTGSAENASQNPTHRRFLDLAAEYHRIDGSLEEPTRTPAMTDGPGFDEQEFIRGNHRTRGEPVPRRFLEAIAGPDQPPMDAHCGRLELARRVTHPSNPFLARVMVNRVWHHLFGQGLVRSVDNFGALGDQPSHRELLDWLADWYRTEARWSTKKLIRLIATSRVYRMSSAPTAAAAEEKDPANALLHRMRLRRLEGEAIRDALLSVSGGLDKAMFGPSVPIHLTPFMEGRGRPEKSGPVNGLGRRTVYLEVRRNFLSPMMLAYDTPLPFTTVGRRTSSNVPAQALTLLNDPFVLQQAGNLAKRLWAGEPANPSERLTRLYQIVFGRSPSDFELGQGLAFLRQQAETYGATASDQFSDLRLWTDLCHVLFNAKEFVFIN